jgi:hypothetical protein
MVIITIPEKPVSLITDKQIKAHVFLKLLQEGKVNPRFAVAGVFIVTPSYIFYSRACVGAVRHILTG